MMYSLPQENRTGISPRAFSTKSSDLKPVGALKLLSVLAEGKRRARLYQFMQLSAFCIEPFLPIGGQVDLFRSGLFFFLLNHHRA